MNVRLEYAYDFMAGVVLSNGDYTLDTYHANFCMITATDSPSEQNIAFERVNYFFNEVIEGGFLVNRDAVDIVDKLGTAGIRTIELPEDPYIQIVGLMLYTKLNAIMEGRIIIVDSDISSINGRGVKYHYCEEENMAGGELDTPKWWHDHELTWVDRKTVAKQKVVKIGTGSAITWADVKLGWDDDGEAAELGLVVPFNKE